MNSLSFQERAFLTLYNRFFGVNYSANNGDSTNLHIQSQKMCYMLKAKGIQIGEFDYSWNSYGPFSAGLQRQLKALDEKQDDVTKYYADSAGKDILFSDTDSPDSLFSQSDGAIVDALSSKLEIKDHNTDSRNWIELLASIMFISRSIFPGEGEDVVVRKLLLLKPRYRDYEELSKAWKILNTAGLLAS